MIEVELPDGTIVEFPADTTNDVMHGAIRSHLAAPSEPQPPADGSLGSLNDMGMPQGPMPAGEGMQLPSAQTALDLTAQGLLTAGGMAAGAPAGPLGSIALGGAGAAAGKRIARDIGSLFGLEGSESYPSAGESTLDVVAGGAGPAASAVARPVVRKLSGVTREMAEKVAPLHENAKTLREVSGFGEMVERAPKGLLDKLPADIRDLASAVSHIARDAGKLQDKALKVEIGRLTKDMAKEGAKLPTERVALGSIFSGIAYGSPEAAAIAFGIGKAASAGRVAAARRIMRSEKAVEWLLDRASSGITPKKLLASLSGLAAVKGLDASTRADIRTLQGETDPVEPAHRALERMMDGDGDEDE